MNEDLNPRLAELLRKFARDLDEVAPSPSLDARIDRLVAGAPKTSRARSPRRWQRPFAWAAAASLAVLAISAGIIIGMKLERGRDLQAAARELARESARQAAMSPVDLAMWPTDSVAFTIPAEYSPQGTLVAVKPHAKTKGKRFFIDVVVSNDGTVRIERIVPANDHDNQAEENGYALQ
jgi:hypothetical protein